MPRRSKGVGKRRPADVTGKAATDELGTTGKGKNAAAVALGRLGGKARAKGLSARRRQEIATGAANKRWEKEHRQAPNEPRLRPRLPR
jgi:hypothetical protein